MTAKTYPDADKLTDEQKIAIKKEFREWSGGYHPGEAGEEHDRFLEEWEETYGHDPLDAFLTQWGEEELAKEAEESKRKAEERKAALKRKFHEIAKSLVTREHFDHQNVVRYDDVTLYLQNHPNKTVAKAEWADLVWLFEKLLERGAAEAAE